MTFISQSEWDTANLLRTRCLSKKFMKDFFADKTAATQVAMDGVICDVLCKGLADGLSSSLIFDLKSTRETTLESFRRSFFNYGYDFQLAFYLRLAWDNGFDFPIDNCYIVACSKLMPYDVVTYRIPAAWLEEAFTKVDTALEIYKRFFDEVGVPYCVSRRPEWDKFAGALYTIAFDMLCPDGRTLQIGTVHNLGQNFAKAFDITYETMDGRQEHI